MDATPNIDAAQPFLELLIQAPEGTQNHYQRSRFMRVEAGQEVARIVGDPALAKHLIGERLELRGEKLVATQAGTLRFEQGKAWVETALQIPGHVDFSTGNIDGPGDVTIGGNVLDLFKVQSGGSIHVGGTVDAAELIAAADIVVAGGIAGKEKAICRAGGELKSRYVQGAQMQVTGNVLVQSELANSRVVCMGKLVVEDGAVVSGHLTANGGVTCQILGNDAGARTLIEVGINEPLRQACDARIPEIETTLHKAQQTRRAVEPLLRNQKQLTAKQKEQATELLYQVAETEDQIKVKLEELIRQRDEGRKLAKCEVRIERLLKPGVVIRVPGLETTTREAIRGPVRVMARKLANGWQLAAVDDRGGLLPLETRAHEDKQVGKLEQLLASIRQVNA